MGYEVRLLINQQKNQATKDRSSVICPYVVSLAEKEGDGSVVRRRLDQLVYYPAQKHWFSLLRVSFNPE